MVDRFLSAPPLVFGLEFSPHTIQCNAICARWTGIFPPDECTSPYMPGRLEFSYLMMADWNFLPTNEAMAVGLNNASFWPKQLPPM